MEVITLKVGEMGTNCYLVSNHETSEAVIIDPGEEGDYIATSIIENKLIPKAIILTHGHYDHCLAALELKINFNLPIYLHPKDIFLYEKASSSARHFSGIRIPHLPPIDHQMDDGEVIAIGDEKLSVIHTPGHTPGSVSLSAAGFLFSGDTLFADGVGRTDLSYSSPTDLKKSLLKISKFPPETTVYPGHGDIFLLEQNSQFHS